jgi:hypothetical protein
MKQVYVLIATTAAFLLSCSKPTEVQSDGAKLDATVGYFLSEVAVGGELDPSGFTLVDRRWYSDEPSYSYHRVYAAGMIDSSYLQKRVSIAGRVDTIIASGVERGTRHFPLIRVDKLTVLD